MNEFKVGDCLYNPKRGSKYIVVSRSEYKHAMYKLFGNCIITDRGLFTPMLALTEAKGLHSPGDYIAIISERINNPDYSSDLDGTYEKIAL